MNLKDVKYEPCDGVYRPAEDTFLLAQIISGTGKVLEIGSGTGILSIACALKSAEVTAVDISQKAVQCTIKNALLNHVSVNAFVSDLFSEVRGQFDEIIFNPPYLPTSDNVDQSEQWDGGSDGFRTTRPFLLQAPDFLNRDGKIRIILSSLTDIDALKSEFSSLKFKPEKSERFDFETIYAFTVTPVT